MKRLLAILILTATTAVAAACSNAASPSPTLNQGGGLSSPTSSDLPLASTSTSP
jgi:hypothetical protein